MNKKTLILAGVLFIMIALAYIYHGPLKVWQEKLGQPDNFLSIVNTGKIDKIEVGLKGKTTVLEKENARWKIGGTKSFYADPELINNFITNLDKASKQELELVSNNKDRKSEFATDNQGAIIKLYQNGKITADFIVGNMSGDYNSTFISTPSLASTFAVKAALYSVLYQEEWRDTTIFSSDKAKINKIRFQYPNREFTLEMVNDKWQGTIPEKFSVNSEKIQNILDLLSNLKTAEIPEQTFNNTGLDKHLIIIQASGEGFNNTLMVGIANKDNLYYAKKGDSDNIYLITKEQRDELDKWIWQLK